MPSITAPFMTGSRFGRLRLELRLCHIEVPGREPVVTGSFSSGTSTCNAMPVVV